MYAAADERMGQMKLLEMKESFGDEAKRVVERNIGEDRKGITLFGGLTTTKLRGIYGLIMNIYTKVQDEGDFEKYRGDIAYLKIKMAYEAGRERSVKQFIEEAGLMERIDEVDSYEAFMIYCRYAESLVAYFKYCGGKDK
jgi:CRISPR-associated protein Csm2